MTHIEREVKLTIAKEDFPKLLALVSELGTPLLTVEQENTYIRAFPQLPGRPKTALRLRKVSDGQYSRFFYTFKTPRRLEGGVSECEETEGLVTERQFAEFCKNPAGLVACVEEKHPGVLPEEFLLAAGVDREAGDSGSAGASASRIPANSGEKFSLSIIARLANTRTIVQWEKWTLELDHCKVLSPSPGELFEVECETQDHEAAKRELCRLMESNGVRYRDSTVTKLEFALEARHVGGEF